MTDDPLKLTIERTFEAPRDMVFDAWTNPQSRVGWWGPKGMGPDVNEIDLRVGGRWRLGMRAQDGRVHISAGVYREISPPGRLVMTHGWEDPDGRVQNETLVSITLSDAGDGRTRMLFEQTGFESAGSRDGHQQGWSEAFDSLEAALAGALKHEKVRRSA
jgi:uncharacterized protein YndB with AHSA1/START domain